MDPDSRRRQPAARTGARRSSAGGGLHVVVSNGRGRSVRDGGLSRWLARAAPARARGEVGLALVTDARLRALNQQYRRKDAATDVLSFPDSAPNLPTDGSRRRSPHLGDIVIATGVARRQAREAGHSYATELRVLALHGLLHLLGYDHEGRGDAGRMARVESRLRRKGGLTEGLIERAGTATARRNPRHRRKAAK